MGGLYAAMQQAGGQRRRRRDVIQGAQQRPGLGRQGAMDMRRARGIGQFRQGFRGQGVGNMGPANRGPGMGVPPGAFDNRDAYRASFGHDYRQEHPWRSVGAMGPNTGDPSDQSRMGFWDREAQLGQMYGQQQAVPDDLLRRRLLLAQQQRMQGAAGGMPLY